MAELHDESLHLLLTVESETCTIVYYTLPASLPGPRTLIPRIVRLIGDTFLPAVSHHVTFPRYNGL